MINHIIRIIYPSREPESSFSKAKRTIGGVMIRHKLLISIAHPFLRLLPALAFILNKNTHIHTHTHPKRPKYCFWSLLTLRYLCSSYYTGVKPVLRLSLPAAVCFLTTMHRFKGPLSSMGSEQSSLFVLPQLPLPCQCSPSIPLASWYPLGCLPKPQ